MVALWLVVAFSCFQSNEYVKLCFVYNFWAPCQLLKIIWKGDQWEGRHGSDWKITLQVFLVFPLLQPSHTPPRIPAGRGDTALLNSRQCQAEWCEVLTSELQLRTSLCSDPGSISVVLWLFALLWYLCFQVLQYHCNLWFGFFSLPL